MQAASTVWKILFDNLDLNSNSRLSASEIVVKLGMNDISKDGEINCLINFDTKMSNFKFCF